MKESGLASYQTTFQKLIKSFLCIQYEHVLLSYNKHIQGLVTLALKVVIPDKTIDVKVIKKSLRATATDFSLADAVDEDWQTRVIQNILQPSSMVIAKDKKINIVIFLRQ